MKKFKFLFFALLLILLPFFVLGCAKSPKSFYTKLCKVAVPFQEKVEDYYGYGEEYSGLSHYSSVDKCVEKSLETEERLYEECLKEKEDKKECQELVDKYRETIAKVLTRSGCENMYGGFGCSGYKVTSDMKKYLSAKEIADMEKEHSKCMEDIEELCEDLPKDF